MYVPGAILKAKVKSVLGLHHLSRLTLIPLFCKLFADCFVLGAVLRYPASSSDPSRPCLATPFQEASLDYLSPAWPLIPLTPF